MVVANLWVRLFVSQLCALALFFLQLVSFSKRLNFIEFSANLSDNKVKNVTAGNRLRSVGGFKCFDI